MSTTNRNPLVHGSNLEQKENHRTKYRDEDSIKYLREIRTEYDKWHGANLQLIRPKSIDSKEADEIIARRVQLLSEYFDIPVVVIECKTYLDKTMLEGSSRSAEDLKARNPNSLYIVVMEWIKLTSDVNLRKYKVDQIYVLRQQKNTDRELRYEETYIKNQINPTVVQHLFKKVRNHLTMDWSGGIQTGIQRGWLIDE